MSGTIILIGRRAALVILLLAATPSPGQSTGAAESSSATAAKPDPVPAPRKSPSDVFRPGSLGYLIWTNFITLTNGRDMRIWSKYQLPTDFPHDYFPGNRLPRRTKPVLAWNTNCLMWGLKGETALSQCWTSQGWPGQVPITALTRRHGYTRGHSMGNAGMTQHFNGHRVYFCTANNQVVEAVVENAYVEIGAGHDFTILLFSRDLPPDIQPIRVADFTTLSEKYPRASGKWIQFQTEQGGNVSAGYPPYIVNTWKAGDSGSPDLLPMPGELVFCSGRSTSGPSRQMQADMDRLCVKAALDPAKYQMQWLDLSSFPTP